MGGGRNERSEAIRIKPYGSDAWFHYSFDCLVSGEEKEVVGLVGLEPTISPL